MVTFAVMLLPGLALLVPTTRGLMMPSFVTSALNTIQPALQSDATWEYASTMALSAVATCVACGPAVRSLEEERERRLLLEDQVPEVPETPYGGGADAYDPELAAKFYQERPLLVAERVISLLQATLGFQLKLFLDWRTGNLQRNEKIRAKEALALATECGPTIIKLAQALSIRTDLIPEAYALELRQLQDAVPPFSDAQAKKVIEQQLGRPIDDVFEDFDETSIASASIGQVYRATLRPGKYAGDKNQASDRGPVSRVAV